MSDPSGISQLVSTFGVAGIGLLLISLLVSGKLLIAAQVEKDRAREQALFDAERKIWSDRHVEDREEIARWRDLAIKGVATTGASVGTAESLVDALRNVKIVEKLGDRLKDAGGAT